MAGARDRRPALREARPAWASRLWFQGCQVSCFWVAVTELNSNYRSIDIVNRMVSE